MTHFLRKVAALEHVMLMTELDAKEKREEPVNIKFCHGPPFCDANHQLEFTECEWCFTISGRDTRTAVSILGDMEQTARRQ